MLPASHLLLRSSAFYLLAVQCNSLNSKCQFLNACHALVCPMKAAVRSSGGSSCCLPVPAPNTPTHLVLQASCAPVQIHAKSAWRPLSCRPACSSGPAPGLSVCLLTPALCSAGKLLAFSGPSAVPRVFYGYKSFVPEDYDAYFKRRGVSV